MAEPTDSLSRKIIEAIKDIRAIVWAIMSVVALIVFLFFSLSSGISLLFGGILGGIFLTLLFITAFGFLRVINNEPMNSLDLSRNRASIGNTQKELEARTVGSPSPEMKQLPAHAQKIKPKPNLRFVRANPQYVDIRDGKHIHKMNIEEPGSYAVVAVFGNEPDIDHVNVGHLTSLTANIVYDDEHNTHIDRACWVNEDSHIVKLSKGQRKELVLGILSKDGRFFATENDNELVEGIKLRLLGGYKFKPGEIFKARVQLHSSSMYEDLAEQYEFKIGLKPQLTIIKIDS